MFCTLQQQISCIFLVSKLFKNQLVYISDVITSVEEVLCLSDSVCVCKIPPKSCERILTKFCGEVEHGPGRNGLDFGGDAVSFVDAGSFSDILYADEQMCRDKRNMLSKMSFFVRPKSPISSKCS